eukprot:3649017-Ditylum_brightwellii.AAC.1
MSEVSCSGVEEIVPVILLIVHGCCECDAVVACVQGMGHVKEHSLSSRNDGGNMAQGPAQAFSFFAW